MKLTNFVAIFAIAAASAQTSGSPSCASGCASQTTSPPSSATSSSTSTTTSAAPTDFAAAPVCADTCIYSAVLGTTCDSTDFTCICQDQSFMSSVTGCIPNDCSPGDQQGVLNVAMSLCYANGITTFPSGSTPTPSPTPTSSSDTSIITTTTTTNAAGSTTTTAATTAAATSSSVAGAVRVAAPGLAAAVMGMALFVL